MSGPEIMKASEVQVYDSGFYDQNIKPKKNALLDSRMVCCISFKQLV